MVLVMRGACLSSKNEGSGTVVGGLVISCEVERSDRKTGIQIEFMRRYVKVVEEGRGLRMMLRLEKIG